MQLKEVKTGSVKPVCGKRPMKKRGVDSREVTISFHRKITKMASQRKNERDLTIYIYRANAIFTEINFQYLSPKGS